MSIVLVFNGLQIDSLLLNCSETVYYCILNCPQISNVLALQISGQFNLYTLTFWYCNYCNFDCNYWQVVSVYIDHRRYFWLNSIHVYFCFMKQLINWWVLMCMLLFTGHTRLQHHSGTSVTNVLHVQNENQRPLLDKLVA